MIDWDVSVECAVHECDSCQSPACGCSCHCFPAASADDFAPMRGLILGCLMAVPFWIFIALIAWGVWRVVHHA